MMSFAFRKMQLILLSDDITTVTFYSKYETDFCITLTLEIPQNTITDFFQNRIKPFFFCNYVGCFEHISRSVLCGIYTAVVDLDGQVSAITGASKI